MTERQCGDCLLCCKLFAIPELDKPKDRWCVHCKPGKGCLIYGEHPETCRTFRCGWLRGLLPEHWYPKRSRMVMGSADGTIESYYIAIDPAYPTIFLREPWHSDLLDMARDHGRVVMTVGDKYIEFQATDKGIGEGETAI